MSTSGIDTSSARWIRDGVFQAAWAYDLAFGWDIQRELNALVQIAALRPGLRVLVPACGTGRYAHGMAARGMRVEAFDINPHMLAFAAEHRAHAQISYRVADMARPLGDSRDCAAALTLCNSFRYLLDEADVVDHLSSMHRRIVPGGLYVIELALNVDDVSEIGEEYSWELSDGSHRVHASWTLTELNPPRSMEVARIRVESSDGRHVEFQSHQPQRLWSWTDLEARCRAACFEVAGVHLPDGSVATAPNRPGRYYIALRATQNGA